MKQTMGCVVLALLLALCWGCQKAEETAGPVAPSAGTQAKAWVPGELPPIGETITISFGGETMEMKVAEVDEAKLEEFGIPKYPESVGGVPIEEGGAMPEMVAMATTDTVDEVIAFYSEELGEGFADMTEMMLPTILEEAKAELAPGEGEALPTDVQELIEAMKILMNMETTQMVMVMPIPDHELTVAVVTVAGGQAPPPDTGDLGDLADLEADMEADMEEFDDAMKELEDLAKELDPEGMAKLATEGAE